MGGAGGGTARPGRTLTFGGGGLSRSGHLGAGEDRSAEAAPTSKPNSHAPSLRIQLTQALDRGDLVAAQLRIRVRRDVPF